MRIAILGASGATGRELVRLALERGNTVRVLVRSEARVHVAGVDIACGDARDAAAVDRAIAGADAVISAIGPSSTDRTICSRATENVVAAMRKSGVARYVFVSGGSVDLDEDRKTFTDRAFDRLVRFLEKGGAEDKQVELDCVRGTDLEWTAARAPRLVDGDAGVPRVSLERLPGRRLARATLATFMLDAIREREYVRRAPFVAS